MYIQGVYVEQHQPRAIRHGRQQAPQYSSNVTVPGVHRDPTQGLPCFDQVWQTTPDQPWSEDMVWSSIIPAIDITYAADEGFHSLPMDGLPSSTLEQPAIIPAASYQRHFVPPSEKFMTHASENLPTSSFPSLWSGITPRQRSNVEWLAHQVENFDGPKAGSSSKALKRANEGSSLRERRAAERTVCGDKERPWQCDQCPATFARKRDCVRHARSLHNYSKPYICKGCGEGFVRSDGRGRHWRLDKKCAELHKELERAADQSYSPSNGR